MSCLYMYIKLGYLIITLVTVVHSFSCPRPEDLNCAEKSIVEANCTYGVIKDQCDNCWECTKGFNEPCGGIFGIGGSCAKGLNCSNPTHGGAGRPQKPGVCCRTVPPKDGQKPERQLCEQVLHPCSLEIVCTKRLGEGCGGQGDMKGICGTGLICSPKFTMTHELDENATCIRQT